MRRQPDRRYPIRWQEVDLLLEPGREAEKPIEPESYCVHLWNEVLRRREIVEPPPGSLLERLLEGERVSSPGSGF